jgi:hypothetical protein
MNMRHERLKLEWNIGAVLLEKYVAGDEITGGPLVIPAGEVIRFDRTAPLIGRMLLIEWRRTKFGVFPETLFKCSNTTSLPKQQTDSVDQYS